MPPKTAPAENPDEKSIEKADAVAETTTGALDGLLKELEAVRPGSTEQAKKIMQQVNELLEKKREEMNAAKEQIKSRLYDKYAEIAKAMKEKFPDLDVPATIEALYQKFQENTVEFSSNPMGRIGNFFGKMFEKIPMPKWFKDFTGIGNGREMGVAVGHMGKRLWYNFLLGVDKLVPSFMAPLFGNTIDNAREALTLMDAEEGFKKALQMFKKGRPELASWNIAWDPNTWAVWQEAFEPTKENARVFVQRTLKATLGKMKIADVQKMKKMSDIPPPVKQFVAAAPVAAPAPAPAAAVPPAVPNAPAPPKA